MKIALPLLLTASLLATPVLSQADPDAIVKAAECQSTYAVQSKLFMGTASSLLSISAGQGSGEESLAQIAASALQAAQVSQEQAIAVLVYAKRSGFPDSFASTARAMASTTLNNAIGATFGLSGEAEANFKMLTSIHAKGAECDEWYEKTVVPVLKKTK